MRFWHGTLALLAAAVLLSGCDSKAGGWQLSAMWHDGLVGDTATLHLDADGSLFTTRDALIHRDPMFRCGSLHESITQTLAKAVQRVLRSRENLSDRYGPECFDCVEMMIQVWDGRSASFRGKQLRIVGSSVGNAPDLVNQLVNAVRDAISKTPAGCRNSNGSS